MSAKKPTPKWCKCFERVNAHLADRNTALLSNMLDNPPRAMVETYQVKTGRGTKKRTYAFATFCPFCGVEYPVRDAGDALNEEASQCAQ